MAEDTTTSQTPSDDQTQNDEVEETTTPEPSTEETTEEAPAEPEETPAEPSEPEGEPEEAAQPEPKGKRAEKRIKGLLERNRDLQDRLAQTQPQTQITPQQAAQGVADIEAYAHQHGQLPAEISADDYQHLLSIRDGRAQAQADIQQGQNAQELAELKREVQVEKRTRQVDRDIRDAVESHDVLNKASEGYDGSFDDLVSEELEEALKENPMLNVRRFIDSKIRVYQKAVARGGEQTSASVAKQAATSALPPQGTPKRQPKSDEDKSIAELEAEIEAKHGKV